VLVGFERAAHQSAGNASALNTARGLKSLHTTSISPKTWPRERLHQRLWSVALLGPRSPGSAIASPW